MSACLKIRNVTMHIVDDINLTLSRYIGTDSRLNTDKSNYFSKTSQLKKNKHK